MKELNIFPLVTHHVDIIYAQCQKMWVTTLICCCNCIPWIARHEAALNWIATMPDQPEGNEDRGVDVHRQSEGM